MPEMHFQIRWPDGSESRCYSPSLVIEDHLHVGDAYPLDEFLNRAETALQIASDRVQQKFGMPCVRAIAQLEQIKHRAQSFADHPADVTILGFDR